MKKVVNGILYLEIGYYVYFLNNLFFGVEKKKVLILKICWISIMYIKDIFSYLIIRIVFYFKRRLCMFYIFMFC